MKIGAYSQNEIYLSSFHGGKNCTRAHKNDDVCVKARARE